MRKCRLPPFDVQLEGGVRSSQSITSDASDDDSGEEGDDYYDDEDAFADVEASPESLDVGHGEWQGGRVNEQRIRSRAVAPQCMNPTVSTCAQCMNPAVSTCNVWMQVPCKGSPCSAPPTLPASTRPRSKPSCCAPPWPPPRRESGDQWAATPPSPRAMPTPPSRQPTVVKWMSLWPCLMCVEAAAAKSRQAGVQLQAMRTAVLQPYA